MIRVEFRYWKNGSGYIHNETIENIDYTMTAQEYVKNLEDADMYIADHDAINVEMYDDDDNLLSEYFWEKEGIKDTVKEIRSMTGLSQAKFAAHYNIPKRTIESWEMGERECPVYVLELLRRAVNEDFGQK